MRMARIRTLSAWVGLIAVSACGVESSQSRDESTPPESTPRVGSPNANMPGQNDAGGGGFFLDDDVAPGTGTPAGCQATDSDHDKDGYTVADGDCNDCDANTNPGAFDMAGNSIDEDCSGKVDDEPAACDASMAIDDTVGMNAAKAIGLCRSATQNATGAKRTWGVMSAAFVKADGTPGMNPLSHGLVTGFGNAHVQEGQSMLVLSCGIARAPGQPGYVPHPTDWEYDGSRIDDMRTTSAAPAGYPKASPRCGDMRPTGRSSMANDPAALQVKIRVPTNAKSFTFNLNFYTMEFPTYICTEFNDYYVTMMDPKVPALPDGNISFDQDKAHISVNNSLLQVCPGPVTVPHMNEMTGRSSGSTHYECPLGTELLKGTGFDSSIYDGPHAATGWLQTQAPVTPGAEITLLFAIWDAGDHDLESTVVIDNFKWSVDPGTGAANTTPIAEPR